MEHIYRYIYIWWKLIVFIYTYIYMFMLYVYLNIGLNIHIFRYIYIYIFSLFPNSVPILWGKLKGSNSGSKESTRNPPGAHGGAHPLCRTAVFQWPLSQSVALGVKNTSWNWQFLHKVLKTHSEIVIFR